MGQFKDLTGLVFGRLTVVSKGDRTKTGAFKWVCICVCGSQVSVAGPFLTNGHTKSCGCFKREVASALGFKDLKGQVFGRLTALECLGYQGDVNKSVHWLCNCICGKQVKIVSTSLLSGNTRSCGCLQKDNLNLVRKSGKDHPSYNFELTDEERQSNRDTREDKIWKTKTKELVDFVCELCNKRGGQLNSHHLFDHKNHKSLRYELWNCAVICAVEHKEFHHIYGLSNTTFNQWLEFYKSKTGKNYFNQRAFEFLVQAS